MMLFVFYFLFDSYFPRNETEFKNASHVLPSNCGNEWGETVIEERVIRVGEKSEAFVESISFHIFLKKKRKTWWRFFE